MWYKFASQKQLGELWLQQAKERRLAAEEIGKKKLKRAGLIGEAHQLEQCADIISSCEFLAGRTAVEGDL